MCFRARVGLVRRLLIAAGWPLPPLLLLPTRLGLYHHAHQCHLLLAGHCPLNPHVSTIRSAVWHGRRQWSAVWRSGSVVRCVARATLLYAETG